MRRISIRGAWLLCLTCAASGLAQAPTLAVRNARGLQLLVTAEDDDPRLRVVLPGQQTSDRTIEILFPEHVTTVTHGGRAEQLYVARPGRQSIRPAWRVDGRSLEYERDLNSSIHLVARATLDDDGVRFRYDLTNRSNDAYDMVTAVTDPRLTGIFHDRRLERTFVHHADGFDLLASETPARLTASLSEWLPARYLASFRWPVPARLVERRDDAITYYNKSRPVDEPFIATVASDSSWVVASFTRETGNVWSNPALTCQHVDPQTPLGPHTSVTIEVKMLILRGSLNDALALARAQRPLLK